MQSFLENNKFLNALTQRRSIPLGHYFATCPRCNRSQRIILVVHKKGNQIFIEGKHDCTHCGERTSKVEEIGAEAAYLAYVGATRGVM